MPTAPVSPVKDSQEAVLLVLWQAIQRLEQAGPVTLTDVMAFMASRPFNMKGQEFEELVAHLLDQQLDKLCEGSPFSASIETTQDKGSEDVRFVLNDDTYGFSVKNYSTARAQIATLAEHLPFFLTSFATEATTGEDLCAAERERLVNEVTSRLPKGITLFALTQDDGEAGLSTWVAALRPRTLLAPVTRVVLEQTAGKTAHKKLDFYCQGHTHNVFSLAMGTNALNRGLWFENGRRHLADEVLTRQLFKVLLQRKGQSVARWRTLSDRQRMSWLLKLLAAHKLQGAAPLEAGSELGGDNVQPEPAV